MWPFTSWHRHRWIELKRAGDGSTIYGCYVCAAHKRVSDTGFTNKIMTPAEEDDYGMQASYVRPNRQW